MLVKELKEILNNADDNDLVVLSHDEDGGGGYSPLYSTELCSYDLNNSCENEIGIRELTPELIEEGYTEDDLIEDGVNAIVLYPVR
jgi:hypothetical protein